MGDGTYYVIISCVHKSITIKFSFCHLMKVIAVHALIIYSEKIGFDHSITCNTFFLLKNTEKLCLHKFFMHMECFADFHRK